MGTWNTGLFCNDTTCDVRDTYIDLLKKQLSNEEAYKKTYEEYKELIGTDEEPLFWYSLAETQWRVGRLTSEVKNKALHYIKELGGLSLWEENNASVTKWKNVLNKLEAKITSPMIAEKKFRKPAIFDRNPWNIGDVYAYQFHTDKAREHNFFQRYILLQKVGDAQWFDEIILSKIQVYDRIFDFLPNLNAIKELRILPLVTSHVAAGYPESIADYVPSFEEYKTATMCYEKKNDYPKEHLFFIGNVKMPSKTFSINTSSKLDWSKDGMDDWLIDYYLSWQNVEY